MSKLSLTRYNLAVERRKAALREVNFKTNKMDKLCLKLLAAGKTYQVIQAQTGYSYGRIGYRAKLADIHAADYRNNITRPYTKMLLGWELTEEYDDSLDSYLEKQCPKMYKVVKLN